MVKILLVEDNAIDAFIAEKVVMLSGADVQLHVADGSMQAIDFITRQYLETQTLPDLILVDQYMPVASGLQFLDAFAALDMPGKDAVLTLMLTNSAEPHLVAGAISRGAKGILSKPLSIPMLKELIGRAHAKDVTSVADPLN